MEKCDRIGCSNERDPNKPSFGWRRVEYDSDVAMHGDPENEEGDYLFCSWRCIAAFASEKAAMVLGLKMRETWPGIVVDIDESLDAGQVEVYVEDRKNGEPLFTVDGVVDLRLQTVGDPNPAVEPKTVLQLNMNVSNSGVGIDNLPEVQPVPFGSNTEGGLSCLWVQAAHFRIKGGQLKPEHNRRGIEWA